MIDIKAHLMALCNAHGVSGYEDQVRLIVEDAWRPLVDVIEVGAQGDLIAIKHGQGDQPRPRLMLCAHMDEIGLIVKTIDRGFIRVSHMGGIDARTLPGTPVIVHGVRPVPGVVGLVPKVDPDADSQNYAPIEALWVDLGLPQGEVEALVRVGDVITVDLPAVALAGDRVAGKAVDDRACIAILTEVLALLQTRRHLWDVVFVASTQEEVSAGGAGLVAEQLRPDAALALDVTFASQPGMNKDAYGFGEGVPVSLGANFHPVLYTAILKAAERLEIKTIPDPLPANSGTDAWEVQVANAGIPTALVNLVIRNMHSSVETVSLGDIHRTARLIAEFIVGLQPDFLTTIEWDTP
jgi:endoglucanase